MKRHFLLLSFIGFLLIILESTLLRHLSFSVYPNLTLIYVVSCALCLGSAAGRRLGLLLGLLSDLLFLNVTGFLGLLYYLLGAGTGFLKTGFDDHQLLFVLMVMAAADLCCCLYCYFFLDFVSGRINFLFYLKKRILPEIIITLPFSVPLFLAVHALIRTLEKKNELPSSEDPQPFYDVNSRR